MRSSRSGRCSRLLFWLLAVQKKRSPPLSDLKPHPAVRPLPSNPYFLEPIPPVSSVDQSSSEHDQIEYVSILNECRAVNHVRSDEFRRVGSMTELYKRMRCDPYTAWNERRSQFPTIFPVAIYALSIPPGAAIIERFFSSAKNQPGANPSSLLTRSWEDKLLVSLNLKHVPAAALKAVDPTMRLPMKVRKSHSLLYK